MRFTVRGVAAAAIALALAGSLAACSHNSSTDVLSTLQCSKVPAKVTALKAQIKSDKSKAAKSNKIGDKNKVSQDNQDLSVLNTEAKACSKIKKTVGASAASIRAAFTVKSVGTKCSTLVPTFKVDGKKLVHLDVVALQPSSKKSGRKSPDSISTPLAGKTPASQLKNLQAAVCVDPLLGVAYANGLANTKVQGVSLGSTNAWLKPYGGNSKAIASWASGFVPLNGNLSPTKAQLVNSQKMNVSYQELAGRVNTLLSEFSLVGDRNQQSVQNIHLVGGSTHGLPNIGANSHQEGFKVLQFTGSVKSACAPAQIGISRDDKRFVVLKTSPCKKPRKK